ncbi:MAG TPA: hypothetical protein DDZ89_16835, partial [Clostridiales bacterium]|nr:hypothetical protein [Clostridiales bacterium]
NHGESRRIEKQDGKARLQYPFGSIRKKTASGAAGCLNRVNPKKKSVAKDTLFLWVVIFLSTSCIPHHPISAMKAWNLSWCVIDIKIHHSYNEDTSVEVS